MTTAKPPPAHRLVPTAVAALALGITAAAVRKLASRGKLTRYGTRQRARYDIDELTRLRHPDDDPATPEDDTRLHPAPSRVTLQPGAESVHPPKPSP